MTLLTFALLSNDFPANAIIASAPNLPGVAALAMASGGGVATDTQTLR